MKTPRQPRKKKPRFTQQGVALIAVMLALTGILVLTNDFGTKTNLDVISAANTRDQMRAHFLARSAMNLSELVIHLQQRLDNIQQMKGVQITEFADLLMTAFGGDKQQVTDLLGPLGDAAKGLGTGDMGTFGVSITTDDDKININCANARGQTTTALAARISALYFFPVYDPIFSEPDADGWRRDRDTQTAAIMDYVDVDAARYGQPGAPEDYGYEAFKDVYFAKNNQLDTTGEMRLIRGVDDRFWTLFGSAFTVYGGCKTNLSAVTDPKVLVSIIMLAAKNPQDPMLQNPNMLWALASLVAKAHELGFVFTSTTDFANFVKDPISVMQMGLSQASSSSGSSAPTIPGLPAGLKGIELDQTKLDAIASAGPRRTYRIQAWGEINRDSKLYPNIRRTITAIWDTNVQPQNYRPPENITGPVPKGAYVFLREE